MSSLPPPEILLERGAVLLLNKPGGILTQGPPGIDSLELRTKQFLIERENKPGKCYLGVPHRLDRPVSGVMVVVKNVRAAQRLSEQIREHRMKKVYWAIVSGNVDSNGEPGPMEWRDWMRKLPDEAKSVVTSQEHPDAKEAILRCEVLERTNLPSIGDVSLLQIVLITGRTHQIRLQTSSRGFPILGDQIYGSEIAFGPQPSDLRKRWIALHAREIGFQHPIDQEAVSCICPLPEFWNQEVPFKTFRESV